jgi:hypothetical protein
MPLVDSSHDWRATPYLGKPSSQCHNCMIWEHEPGATDPCPLAPDFTLRHPKPTYTRYAPAPWDDKTKEALERVSSNEHPFVLELPGMSPGELKNYVSSALSRIEELEAIIPLHRKFREAEIKVFGAISTWGGRCSVEHNARDEALDRLARIIPRDS